MAALQWSGSAWRVPVTLDGAFTPFLLDTGAERSMLFADAAQRLHVARDQWVATATRGIAGVVRQPNANPRSLALAGLDLRRGTLAADNSLTVGEALSPDVSGLLGQDFLSPYDLDLDGRANTLGLYAGKPCLDAADLPWTGPRAAIPATRLFRNVLVIPVEIDGRVLHAEIDSGAAISVVTAAGMRRLGLTDADLADGPARAVAGIGGDGPFVHLHRFQAVTIGGQHFAGQPLWVGPIQLVRSIDMLLGADWLRGRRVWFSFAAGTVFVGTQPGNSPFP